MWSHLCSERSVWLFMGTVPEWPLLDTPLPSLVVFTIASQGTLETFAFVNKLLWNLFFNSSFCLISPPLILQVSKQQDCFGGNFLILSHECSSQRSAADVFCKLYTAFIWDQRVALAVGLNLCLAVYVGWYTISDISDFRTVSARLCCLQLLLTKPLVWFMVVYCLYLYSFSIKL